MSDLKIKQISNLGSLPNSYIAFNGSKNVWQKIRHNATFSVEDLEGGVLLVDHGLGRKYVQVTIYDENDFQVLPDQVRVLENDQVEVHLHSFESSITDWVILVS